MNFLQVENKLSDTDSFINEDPLSDVSYNSDYAYNKIHVKTKYNVSCDLFRKFITEKVFKVSGGDNYVTGHTDDGYYITDSGSHLAGTFLSWQIGGNDGVAYPLNMGILIEETVDDNGDTISKVGIELREQEPLMQTIIDCTGKVYDFKGGVKFSDFKKFINQTKGSDNLVEYDVLHPTNVYNKSSTGDGSNENGKDDIPYDKYRISTSDDGSFRSKHFTTNMRGYFILCSFVNDTEGINDVNKLIACKPVITVIRLIDVNKCVNYNNNLTFDDVFIIVKLNNTETVHFRNFAGSVDLLYSCILKSQYGVQSVAYNYYILDEMKTN